MNEPLYPNASPSSLKLCAPSLYSVELSDKHRAVLSKRLCKAEFTLASAVLSLLVEKVNLKQAVPTERLSILLSKQELGFSIPSLSWLHPSHHPSLIIQRFLCAAVSELRPKTNLFFTTIFPKSTFIPISKEYYLGNF